MLQIYNTMTRKKEPFRPLTPGKVGMYVCGLTVYDYCHVGHARMFTAFDMVVRYLRFQNYEVRYVRNITDIDDKIILRAQKNNEPISALTERFIEASAADLAELGLLKPDVEPKATSYIAQIIAMIERLMAKGLAYVGSNGDVFYAVDAFADYGQLSQRQLEDLQAGARVEVTEAKKNPLDFVLWKMAKAGEPAWDSPWGEGRPGWHIECSAMSTHCLGLDFDIHGGGFDLTFPHHENEIAQARGADDSAFVRTWMHSGFVTLHSEKMSKSLNNFFTLREVLKLYDAETLRYFLLSSHYRSHINFSDAGLNQAHQSLQRLYTALRGIEGKAVASTTSSALVQGYRDRFIAAMNDDFNTPEAFAILFEMAHELNRFKAKNETDVARVLAEALKTLGGVLGLLARSPEAFLQGEAGENGDQQLIQSLIEQRNQARLHKNWQEADKVRDRLHAMGIELEDGAEGTTWRRINLSA